MNTASLKRSTLIYATLLMVLGVIGYLVTGMASITALIPAFFGVVIVAVMLLLLRGAQPAVGFWVLVGLAGLGLLATVGGIPKLVQWIMGQETARPTAVASQSIMAALSALYLVVLFRQRRSSGHGQA